VTKRIRLAAALVVVAAAATLAASLEDSVVARLRLVEWEASGGPRRRELAKNGATERERLSAYSSNN
jgi:hypothetical protein